MNDTPNRRPGPMAFRAESKVTTQKSQPSPNKGGIGEAAGPFLETPKGAKELKVAGVWVWVVLGVVVALLGSLLLSPFIALVGVAIIVGAVFVRRRNATEARVRDSAGGERF